MPDLFHEESDLFLQLLKQYENNEINLKTVIAQCKRMNILYFKEEINKKRMDVFQFVKEFNDKLNEIENEYQKENGPDNHYETDQISKEHSKDRTIRVTPKFIQYCAHLGLSQNIPVNRIGGLPAYPQKDMLTMEPVEEQSDEAFEF